MSRLLQGVTLILMVLAINAVIALIQTSATTAEAPDGCTTANNFTTCEQVGKTSFLASILAVTVTGPAGLPATASIIYVLIMATLLVAGALLVLLAFVPLTGA